jgi:alcohol dehydrogenase YqhD (iron-dependent ADH family)
MDNFEFHNPVHIVFGRGRLKEAGIHMAHLGRSVLLCTGRGSVRKSGAFDKVAACLAQNGISFTELSGIQSNPLLSLVREGIKLVRERDIDAVLAVGGGSVMDTAKAVAAGAVLDGDDIWDCFTGRREIRKALPLMTIPTLAASGSEMNGFMVITDEDSGLKLAAGSPHVYPAISILDPELTFTVPADYTAYGGLDAVCHLLEPYFNRSWPDTPVQDGITHGLISAIVEATEKCLLEPDEYSARANLMWGATLALNGLTKAGVGEHFFPVHMIEHSISALFDVPHGAGLAALLPGWMEWFAGNGNAFRVAAVGQAVFGVDKALPDGEAASEMIVNFSRWLKKINCPADLHDLSISSGDHRRIAENAMVQAEIWGINKIYTSDRVVEILERCQERSV